MNSLDELLSQPLAAIEDNQFSEQVLKRIKRYYWWRSLVLKSLSLALCLLFIVLSSPALLFEKFSRISDFFVFKFSDAPQIEVTTILSQIAQQPILVLVFIISLVMIFDFQEN